MAKPKSKKTSFSSADLKRAPTKRAKRSLGSIVEDEIERQQARKAAASYRYGPDMEKRFIKIFFPTCKKEDPEFYQKLVKRWPKGDADMTFFSYEQMGIIANENDQESAWTECKNDILKETRPSSTQPPSMVVYDNEKLGFEDTRKKINPMELARRKANDILQDITDEVIEGRSALNMLRVEEISPMIVNMMVATFMASFEPDAEEDPDGEYLLENQNAWTKTIASELQQYAMEVKNQKKSTKRVTRKRISKSGVTPAQMEKAMETFKFRKIDDSLKISSVDASQVFGSVAVLLYSIKYRKATYLEAIPNSVLALRGSSIIGFDPGSAMEKTVKDPKKQLDWSTRSKASKSLKDLKTKSSKGNGRSNEETVILAVFK